MACLTFRARWWAERLRRYEIGQIDRPPFPASHGRARARRHDACASSRRCPEDHRLRDLVGRAYSTERRGRGGFRLHLRALLVAQAERVLVPGRDDRAWAHDVDTNLAALQIN